MQPLYRSIVATGRDPVWYRDGSVPDSVDGRFDMIATILSLVLIRLEQGGEAARADAALLTELFIADMDGNIRQMGTGDLMVGKNIGKMMGALGGRIGTMRGALDSGEGLEGPVSRNIFHDAPPSDAAVSFIAARLERFHNALGERPVEAVIAGDLPAL
ncbi:ubiquinol-cytochrome C chaperone family protein [Allosphingosinicella flava]|uniref:ubiquinol-cytochrome C chaperone family protein n=1 Tax=Allosphingosinicella flava TaxID=2771430 RepID=UPI001CF79903|nr:ubiquinol-cytochrome C chaperone family protein [Sphingosinicella flava]